MSELGPESVDDVLQACGDGAVMAGLALSETLGRDVTMTAEGAGTLAKDHFPSHLKGPGVLLVLEYNSGAAILILPASIPFLPAWCHDGQEVSARMESLAKQMRVVLPSSVRATSSWAIHVRDIEEALDRAGHNDPLPIISLGLDTGKQRASISLVWPLAHVEQLLIPEDVGHGATGGYVSAGGRSIRYANIEEGIAQLPPYSRSLLKIAVPVSVTLATTRQTVRRLLELSPGAIISFKKSCDETLALEVGGHTIADGEAVKVGDKFGLWITQMTLPKERFQKVVGDAVSRHRSP